jgi:hypothetical protein
MMVFAELNHFDPFEFLRNLDENSTKIFFDAKLNFTGSVEEKEIRQNKSKLIRNLIRQLKTDESVLNLTKIEVFEALVDNGVLHSQVINNFSSKVDLGATPDSSLYKFVFLRHPFERIVSAYYDKFVHLRDPEFIQSIVFHETPPGIIKISTLFSFTLIKKWHN